MKAQTHGLLLLFCIGHSLFFLGAGDHLFQIPRRFQVHAQQPHHLPGHGVLLAEQGSQIDHGLAPDILFHHLLPLKQLLQLIFHILFSCAAQGCSGCQQFFPRDKTVAALQIEGEFIQNRGPQPHRTQRVHAHVPGGLVHLAKVQTKPLLAQKIGVLPQSLLCIGSIDLVDPGGTPHGQTAFGEKLQKGPHGILLEKILLDLPGFPRTDAPHCLQKFRLTGQHIKGVFPEFFHNGHSGFGSDALDGTGGQIVIDPLGGGGQQPLIGEDGKLRAVFRMGHIVAVGHNALPCTQIGHDAGDHQLLSHAQIHPGHRPAAVVVLINQGIHHTLDLFQFPLCCPFHPGKLPPLLLLPASRPRENAGHTAFWPTEASFPAPKRSDPPGKYVYLPVVSPPDDGTKQSYTTPPPRPQDPYRPRPQAD